MENRVYWRITRKDLPCLRELEKWLNEVDQKISADEDLELLVQGEFDDSQPGKDELRFYLASLDPSKEPEQFGPYTTVNVFVCLFLGSPDIPGYLSGWPDDQQAVDHLSTPPGDIGPS